jgi:hypothetical protein
MGAIDRCNMHVLLMPTTSMTTSTFAAKAGLPVMSVPHGYYQAGTGIELYSGNGLVDVAPVFCKTSLMDPERFL